MAPPDLLSLDLVSPGAAAIVRRLTGGSSFASRLAAMGLSVGSQVEILQNRGRGPVLALVRDTRIALGRGEAVKVMVEVLDGEQRAEP